MSAGLHSIKRTASCKEQTNGRHPGWMMMLTRTWMDLKTELAPSCTVQAICVCKGISKDWDSAKKMLADPSFTRTLLDYDKDHVPVEVIARLKPYMANPEFLPEAVGKQSKAAKGLCMWVRAIFAYDAAMQASPPGVDSISA